MGVDTRQQTNMDSQSRIRFLCVPGDWMVGDEEIGL